LNVTITFLGIIGAAVLGPLVLAAVLAGVMVWLSKQVTAVPASGSAPAATVRKAVTSQPPPPAQSQSQPQPQPKIEVESFVSEAADLEKEDAHKRLVPTWLGIVYAVVILWALVYILIEVVPFFKPLTPQAASAPAVVAPPAAATPTAPSAPQPVASTGQGVPANGEKLFTAQGCAACHSFKEGERIVGPSLYHIGQTAAQRIKAPDYRGKAASADAYIRESIVDPSLYVVPGFPAGVMVQDFAKKLTPQEIDDLVAFLMTN
jgi:cytochrome c2